MKNRFLLMGMGCIVAALLIQPDKTEARMVWPEPEYMFSRDLLRETHDNWIRNTSARLIDAEIPVSEHFGYLMATRYVIAGDTVTVNYHLDARLQIYDVGLDPADYGLSYSEAVNRVISRILWSIPVSDPSLLSGLWQVSSQAVHISYEMALGDEMEHIRVFRSDVSSLGHKVDQITVGESGTEVGITFHINGRKLSFMIQPNINLYLNGQPDVVSHQMEALLAGDFSPPQITKIHPAHEFSAYEQQFTIRVADRISGDRQLAFSRNQDGWICRDPPVTFSSEEQPAPVTDETVLQQDEQLAGMVYSYWLTRNFPENYRSSMPVDRDHLSVTIHIDGVMHDYDLSGRRDLPDNMGWFGNELFTHVEVSGPVGKIDDSRFKTYILYFDPVLDFQHLIRVEDVFERPDHESSWRWLSSTMRVLPVVRLDNIGDIYGQADFPAGDFEWFFE